MTRPLLALWLFTGTLWGLRAVKAEQASTQSTVALGTKYARLVFPTRIREMMQWPSQETIDRRFIPTQKFFFPRDNSVKWIKKMVRREWLPPDVKPGMIFIKNEYTYRGKHASASHLRWEANGYSIQVAQTRRVIVFVLTPLKPTSPKQTRAARIQYAKDLILQVIPDEYVAEMDKRRRFSNLHKVITDYSFSCALIVDVKDGCAAAASNHYTREIGNLTTAPADGEPTMWFHFIGWYTDGQSVAFWTFRTEGDSWVCGPIVSGDCDPPGRSWFWGIDGRKAPRECSGLRDE